MSLVGVVVLLAAVAFAVPNPSLTPGAVDAQRKLDCGHSNADNPRTVTTAERRVVWRSYGYGASTYARDHAKYEFDHVIPHALDGADTPANIWPQILTQAKVKDRLEVAATRRVCAGTMSLEHAQQRFAIDWRAFYREVFGTAP